MALHGGALPQAGPVRGPLTRATAYFAVCLLVAAGVRPSLSLDAPLLAVAGLVVLEVVAYGVVWPLGTYTLDRPRDWFSPVFGLVWGVCEGLLLLSLATAVGNPWVAFVVLSAFQGVWHAAYWDRRVAPEHNDPRWNLPKVLLCHVPNLALTLWFLHDTGAGGWFVLFQVVSLTLSATAMRFPRERPSPRQRPSPR